MNNKTVNSINNILYWQKKLFDIVNIPIKGEIVITKYDVTPVNNLQLFICDAVVSLCLSLNN